MNFDLISVLKNIRSIAKALSLIRIIKLFSVTVISITLYTLHERRTDIFSTLLEPLVIQSTQPHPPKLNLNEDREAELQNLLRTSPAVNGIAVVSVDIRQNTKTILLKLLDKKVESALSALPLQQPLFTQNSEMNNRTIILMAGEMHCMNSTEANLGSVMAELSKLMPFSCAIPIPPTYGDFSGWIFVGFDRPLSDIEFIKFRTEINKISAAIKRGA